MGQNAPITEDRSSPHDREHERRQDGELVARALAGDDLAFGRLHDVWADRVFDLALRIVRDHDVAADVGQDAFLSAWRSLAKLEDPASFGGWLLRITRNRALDQIKASGRTQPTDGEGLEMIERRRASPSSAPRGFDLESRLARAEDPEAAASDGEVVALVRQTVAALGERDGEVLDLQLRYHLTPAEVAEVIGINRNAANQLCHRVRARFASAFGVRMLWNGRRPACPELRALLASADVDGFGPEALPLASGHADGCTECGDRRRSRLDPSALFAAVPLVPMAGALRAAMVDGLAGSGVPMGGATVGRTPSGSSPSASSSASPDAPSAATGDGPPRIRTASGSAGSAEGDRPGSAARRLAVAGVAVLALLVALLVVDAGVDPSTDAEQTVAARVVDTTIATAPSAGSSAEVPRSTDRATPAGPAAPADPAATSSTGAPAVVATTAPPPTTPTPTVTVPQPSIEQFDLAPSTPQGYGYRVGGAGPVLTWTVTGATAVTVTSFYDDGVNGRRLNRVESTETSGRLDVCPGPLGADSTCQAPRGRYTYVIEATGAAGDVVTSDVTTAPGFEIQPPVID